MRKTNKSKKPVFNSRKHLHISRGMAFGLAFGALMTVVGLAQLLAAPFVGTSLKPASQNAGVNQTKTITVYLDSGTKDVNGGFVHVNFDAAKLSFVSLGSASSEFRIIQQQITANSVAFEYQSTRFGGDDGQFNIANISFKTKVISGTQTAFMSGSAGAYEGRSDPDYYPASNLSASITITGPVVQPSSPASPSSPSPSPSSVPNSSSPAPPGSASPSSPARSGSPQSVASSGAPSSPPTPEDNPTAADETPTIDDENNLFMAEDESIIQSDKEPNSSDETDKTNAFSLPPAAIIGIIILVADGVYFLYYRRYKTRKNPLSNHKKHAETSVDRDIMPLPPPPPAAVPANTAPVPAQLPPATTSPPPQPVAQPVSRLAIKQTWGDIRKDQAERIAHGDKNLATEHDLPDMFDLANQHPESFGSQTLYDEEAGGKPQSPQKPKT